MAVIWSCSAAVVSESAGSAAPRCLSWYPDTSCHLRARCTFVTLVPARALRFCHSESAGWAVPASFLESWDELRGALRVWRGEESALG
eukprot:5721240-Pyramimonas_sp.AAC.1